ncbi:MAG: hypothetical protein ACR2GY_10235 [Phycisphaerales bacterium]
MSKATLTRAARSVCGCLLVLTGAVLLAFMTNMLLHQDSSNRERTEAQLFEIVSSSPERLGELPVMATAERSVVLRNVSSRPIELELRGLSCSSVDIRFEKKQLMPQETSTFRMSTLVYAEQGVQSHYAGIRATGGGRTQDTQIEMLFASAVVYFVQPLRMVIHQTVGGSGEASCVVRPHSTDQINIISATTDLGESVTTEVQNMRAGEGQGVHLKVVTAIAQPGTYQGQVRVTTDSSQYPDFVLPITVRVEPAPAARIPVVMLDGSRGEGSLSAVYHLPDDMSGPATPDSLRVTSDVPQGITIRFEQEANGGGRAAIRFSTRTAELLEDTGSTDIVIADHTGNTCMLRLVWIGGLAELKAVD